MRVSRVFPYTEPHDSRAHVHALRPHSLQGTLSPSFSTCLVHLSLYFYHFILFQPCFSIISYIIIFCVCIIIQPPPSPPLPRCVWTSWGREPAAQPQEAVRHNDQHSSVQYVVFGSTVTPFLSTLLCETCSQNWAEWMRRGLNQ